MSERRFDPYRVIETLNRHHVRYVIIGGFAAALRGSPLITHDLDACYARDDANLAQLAAALNELHAKLREHRMSEDLPFILDEGTLRNGDHFTFVTDAGPADFLGTPTGTSGYADLASDAEVMDVDGESAAVASIDDLMRMKLRSARLKDQAGLEWLRSMRDMIEGGQTPP